MALFTIADLHLSLTAEKPMDVFGKKWEGYVERIRTEWLARVEKGDTVVLPGDFSWGMTLLEAEADFRFLDSLPGEKILLKGNHDYWWNSLSKMNSFLEEKGISSIRFLQNDAIEAEGKILCGSRGWICEEKMAAQDEKILAREALRFSLSLKKGAALRDRIRNERGFEPEILCFSHYPLITSAQRENPVLPVLEAYGVKRVYYGHLHQWEGKPLFPFYHGIEFHLIASDHISFIPQKIE